MKKLTLQNVFDRAWKWFVVEGHPQSIEKGSTSCLYRGPKGAKCAIGICIPDKMYNKEMEGEAVDDLYESFPEVKKLFACKLKSLMDFQQVHDADNYYKFEWKEVIEERLRKYGLIHRLRVPKVKTL